MREHAALPQGSSPPSLDFRLNTSRAAIQSFAHVLSRAPHPYVGPKVCGASSLHVNRGGHVNRTWLPTDSHADQRQHKKAVTGFPVVAFVSAI